MNSLEELIFGSTFVPLTGMEDDYVVPEENQEPIDYNNMSMDDIMQRCNHLIYRDNALETLR